MSACQPQAACSHQHGGTGWGDRGGAAVPPGCCWPPPARHAPPLHAARCFAAGVHACSGGASHPACGCPGPPQTRPPTAPAGMCYCNSTFAHGRVPADPHAPPGTPPQRTGRPIAHFCRRGKVGCALRAGSRPCVAGSRRYVGRAAELAADVFSALCATWPAEKGMLGIMRHVHARPPPLGPTPPHTY